MAEMLVQDPNKIPKNGHEVAFEISTSLSSPEFLTAVHEFPDDRRNFAVDASTRYLAMRLPAEQLGTFLGELHGFMNVDHLSGGQEYDSLLLEHVNRTIAANSNTPEVPATEEEVFSYVQDKVEKHGFVFHGFNSAFTDKIKTEGLTIDKRPWDIEKIKAIDTVLSKVGKHVFGWLLMGDNNHTLYASEKPLSLYGYSSPEWFGQFVAEGPHIPINHDLYNKNAYLNRDKKAARQNLEAFCEANTTHTAEDIALGKAYPNLTESDVSQVLNFFEEHWTAFAGNEGEHTTSKIALISRSALEPARDFSYSDFKKLEMTLPVYLAALHSDTDKRITHNIPSDKVFIADLPSYSAVHVR